MSRPEPQEKPVLGSGLLILMYGVMLAAALIWGWATGRPNVFVLPERCSWWGFVGPALPLVANEHGWDWTIRLAAGAMSGLLLAFLTVGFSRLSVKISKLFRDLHDEFVQVLANMRGKDVLVAALTSAVAEEALFRGVLLCSLGPWISSAIFGAIHMGPNRRFALWPFTAFVMGLLLCVVCLTFGHLLGAVLAHFLINYLNLREIISTARKRGLIEASVDP